MYRQLVVVLAFVVVLLPSVTWAQGFTNLVNIPGLEGEEGLREYLAAFFYLSIGIAALLAVVKLVIAGARYMLSDVANQKEAAKADIRGAVIGLLIILATYILLNTINTQILETDIALQPYEFPEIPSVANIEAAANPGDAIQSGVSEEDCNDRGGEYFPINRCLVRAENLETVMLTCSVLGPAGVRECSAAEARCDELDGVDGGTGLRRSDFICDRSHLF